MIGCLCIHGFTGAPYEVEPLTLYLRENTDWKVVAPAHRKANNIIEKKLVFLTSSPHHVCHGQDYQQLEDEVSIFFKLQEKSS